MANVLGTLFGNIANAIRGKTGETGTMKPAEFPDKIWSITVGNGAVEDEFVEFLPNTTFTNEYVAEVGAFACFVPLSNETYDAWIANEKAVTVVYDGEEYNLTPQTVTGFDGLRGVAVGDLSSFGGTGNGEPFAVVSWGDGNVVGLLVGSTVDTAPAEHTVRIYHEPGAIADGEWLISKGTITTNETGEPMIVGHNLGRVPDIVYVVRGMWGPLPSDGEEILCLVCGCIISEKMLGNSASELDQLFGYVFLCTRLNGSVVVGQASTGLENMTEESWSTVCKATENSMQIGTNEIHLLPDASYSWVALARR